MKKRRDYFLCFVILIFSHSIASAEFEDVNIHGFISQGYMISDHNNYFAQTDGGSFQFNEMGINFSQNVTDSLQVGVQFFAKDLGDLGNDAIELDWAYGDYFYKEYFGLRVGLLKLPLGFFGETRDFDILRPHIYLPSGIYNEGIRDSYSSCKGIAAYGDLDFNYLGAIAYQIQYGLLDNREDSGILKYATGQMKTDIDKMGIDPAIVVNLTWRTPVPGLIFTYVRTDWNWSLSGTSQVFWEAIMVPEGSPVTITLDNYFYRTLSIQYLWNSFRFVAEMMNTGGDVALKVGPFPVPVQSRPYGRYLQATYLFTDWFELSVYYTEWYSDPDNKDGTADNDKRELKLETVYPDWIAYQRDWALSFCFYLNSSWLFKLELHTVEGNAVMFYHDNLDENGNYVGRKYWNLLAAKVSYTF